MDVLVSTNWLATRLNDPDVVILDGSWYMPAEQRDTRAEYQDIHIPGAHFFDIDAISDQSSDLPHMLPSVELFAQNVGAMGIGQTQTVVIYDTAGVFSAARVWWMFRVFGAQKVVVLDGGMKKWIAEGRPTTGDESAAGNETFAAVLDAKMVKNAEQVFTASQAGDVQILDARAGPRFRGEVAEPRAGLRSGHIPGSTNLFFLDLLNSDGTVKSVDEFNEILEAKNISLESPVITSCGSGVTASVLSLLLERAGHSNHAVYDGSWSEWGMENGLPVATG